MTRRKWLSHVVAAVSLTAFIVLGQSCATTETPEQARARQQAEEARQREEARQAWVQAFPQYDWEGDFMSVPVSGGVRITRFTRNRSEVRIPSQIRGESVIEIGHSAFSEGLWVRLTSVTIPDGVVSIGDEAFAGNRLVTITIPDSVTSIGRNAFARNQLTNVTIPDSVTSIGGHAFASNRLTSVIIPDSVTSIGEMVFALNLNLAYVTIPDSLANINSEVFLGTPFGTQLVAQRQAERRAQLAELYRQTGQSLGNLAHTTWQQQGQQNLSSFAFGNGTFTQRGGQGQILATGTFRVSGNTVVFLNSAGAHSEAELAGYRLRSGTTWFNRVF